MTATARSIVDGEGLNNILKAARFAAHCHAGQTRKGNGNPYINHPLEVASLLADVGGVTDTDLIAAALLHDTIEDCDVTADDLAQRFGPAVSAYVVELSDDKSLAKAERKKLQIEHAPHLSPGAKQIKLCDKISNIRDVTNRPPAGWTLERRREYIDWGEAVAAGLKGANAALETCFNETVKRARRELI